MIYIHYLHYVRVEHPGLVKTINGTDTVMQPTSLDWREINCPVCQRLYMAGSMAVNSEGGTS